MGAPLLIMAAPFATPDFGAGACVFGIIALIWVAIMVGALVGVIRGVKLIGQEASTGRRKGIVLLVVSGAVPLSCCIGPSLVFRLNYGSFPLSGKPYGTVKEGMSTDDVRAALGEPHNRVSRGEDGEGWYYYLDSFEIGWFCVDFGPDDRVSGTHGN